MKKHSRETSTQVYNAGAPDYAVPQGDEKNENKIKRKGKIVTEIKEKRERNVKQFLKDDMTFEAAIYSEPVHYLSGGKWKDIDNSLIEGKDDENNDVLENKENNFNIKIAKKVKSRKLIIIKKDKYEMAWGIDNAKEAAVQVKDITQETNLVRQAKEKHKRNKHRSSGYRNRRRTLDENWRKIVLPNLSSVTEFNDVFTNIDIQYEIESDKVKEKIIIKDIISNPKFSFNIDVKNLMLLLQQDNSILCYDDKDNSKLIFKINTPFMYDSKGVSSSKIQLSLTGGNKQYKLIYTPDNEWINDKERVFPITIDPTTTTPLYVTSIEDSFIGSNTPNQNNMQAVLLGVGLGSQSGITRSYIKFTLPTSLTTADTIIDARLYLSLYTANSTTNQINVHKVTQDWSSASITWNNQPQYDTTKIEDYQLVQGTAGADIAWEITSMVKEWHSIGTNYGLMLKNNDESIGYNEFFSSDTDAAYTGYRPQIVLNYIDNSGLEAYWTYHSQDLRRAGTGYINDYNGNVIFVHNDISMSGSRMPLTLNHVFNSNEKDADIGYGTGWRLNLSQRVESVIIDTVQWYKFTDEDSTKHYFSYDSSSGTYKEELGTNLTLYKNSDGSYSIKDKNGGSLEFTQTGYLYKVEDKNGNTLTLSYDGAILKTVTDGAGRVTTLDVLTNGYLVSVTDPGGRKTSFSYNGVQLSQVTYTDGKYSTFTYDTDNKLLTVTNYDGYKIAYSYYSQLPYRASKVQEYGSDGLPGGNLNISYGYNTTTFVTNFADGTIRKSIYQFNDSGNTMCIKEDDDSAQYYKYSTGNNTNKLALDSKLQKFGKNYLRNHTVEAAGDVWNAASGDGSQGSSGFSTDYAYIGKQSLKISKPILETAGYQVFSQPITLQKGSTYTFSAYVKTIGISNTSGQGAYIYINYQDSTGKWIQVPSTYINGTNDWQRIEVTVSYPSDALSTSALARVGIIEEYGTAYFDCLQLEDGSIANRYNLMENADLTYGQDMATYWSKSSTCDANDKSLAVDGKTAFMINGVADQYKNFYKTVNVSGSAGDVFSFGAWAKGASAPISGNRHFSIDIGILKTDGTYQWVETFFNEDTSDWQYISDKFITNGDYQSITLYALYYNNVNSAYFTDFQLYKEEFGYSYEYDDNGNVVSATDLADQKSTFEYANNDLTKAISPAGSEFQYVHDDKHNLTKATSATNVVYSFDYDSSGNPVKATVGDSSLFIEADARYSLSGSYLKSMTDSEGKSVINHYDEADGILIGNTDAKGNKTTYAYDNMDRLLSVSKRVDARNVETFLVDTTTSGDRGTKTIEENAVFDKDFNGNIAFASYEATSNLLTNSSFEGTTTAWSLEDWDNSTGKWRLASDSALGTYSLEAYDSDGLTDGSATNVVAYQLVALPAALTAVTQFTLSAYAKRIGGTNPELGIRCFDAGGSEITSGYQSYPEAIPENQWVRISNTFNVPSGTKSFFVILRSHAKDAEVIRFDAVQMEQSAVVTPYTDGSRAASTAYYDLGLNKNSGTLAVWFDVTSFTSSPSVFILGNEGSSGEIFNVYIDTQKNIIVNCRNAAGVIQNIITAGSLNLAVNQWYFIALRWQMSGSTLNCTLYVNNVPYTNSISDFKDFTGGITAIGSSIFGLYQLNGFLKQFTYTPEALSSTDITDLYNNNLNVSPGSLIISSYSYENDRIKTITHNGFSYSFDYDSLGNNKAVSAAGQNLIQNVYEAVTGNLIESDYGNGQKVSIEYDDLDRITSRKFKNTTATAFNERYNYQYDNAGNLGYHEDKVNNKSYRYIYDLADRLAKITDSDGNFVRFGYDKNNNQGKVLQKINGIFYETAYSYDKDNKPYEVLYGEMLQNNSKVEYFTLNGTTTGSKGTQPVTQSPVYEIDEKGNQVLSVTPGTKVVYNLGINKISGTITEWINAKSNDFSSSRMIFATEGSTQVFNVYIDTARKVNLAVRTGGGAFTNIITTDETIDPGVWYFIALKWQMSGTNLSCTIYVNSKPYAAGVTDFQDFTGFQTALGSNISGNYPLNGDLKNLTYSSDALSEAEILVMYYNNRQVYAYDSIGRITSKTMNINLNSFATQYTYINNPLVTGSTTNKIATITNNGVPISYQYDANGNITKITQGNMNINYYYNELNELIQEDNQVLNKTVIYSYDSGGNLTSKLTIPYDGSSQTTITYSYDAVWKDKLINYNGITITYDNIGNPLTYDGNTYTWEEGRQLSSIVGNGHNISFKYNDSGIRTEKTVDGVTTKYLLSGSRVIMEDNGTDKIYYTYDSMNNLVSMNLNGVEYYYIRNAQGDIIGLYDSNVTQVAAYVYDSWGKLISITGTLATTVGAKNPYRYRGYRYDTETGLYYLQSRYYNPEWGRYLNADAAVGKIGIVLSHNVFSYCKNNVVNMIDESGHWPKWLDNVVNNTVNYLKELASDVKATAKEVVSSVSSAFSFSSWEPLGHKNWQYRHEEESESTREEEHVHLRGEGKEYQQDIKGGRRTKQNPHGLPNPPKKVRKALKEKTGWDWDKNASENIIAKTLVISGSSYLVYRFIRMIPSLLPPLWWTIPTNLLSP